MKKEHNLHTEETQALNIPVVMPRISHFTDENGNNVDICAGGVNVVLKRDGTHEYLEEMFDLLSQETQNPIKSSKMSVEINSPV